MGNEKVPTLLEFRFLCGDSRKETTERHSKETEDWRHAVLDEVTREDDFSQVTFEQRIR